MPTLLDNSIEEDKPHNCRALSISSSCSTSRNNLTTTSLSSSSSFITFRISHQKIIRIKVPNLLSKTIIHKTTTNGNGNHNGNHTDESKNKNKKRWAKPRNLLPKKVGFMACNFFCGNKKPSPPQEEDGNEFDIGHNNGLTLRECMEEREVEPDVLGSVWKSSSEQVSSSNLKRVPRSGGGGRKKVMIKQADEESEEEEEELCKKRILMGEKCRPLNLSGALHYDKNGVLLPEEVFPM